MTACAVRVLGTTHSFGSEREKTLGKTKVFTKLRFLHSQTVAIGNFL